MKTIEALPREARRLAGSFAFQTREHGVAHAVRDGFDLVWSTVAFPFVAKRLRSRTFELEGRSHPYFVHPYNRAYRNERTIELTLGDEFMTERAGTRLLEIGNVMSHYGRGGHDVLDKYEASPNVINEDIVDFVPAEPYESILTISTLEHVGWDEKPRQPDKTLLACQAMRRMLAPGGVLLLTCPVGQNSYLDDYIADGALPFDEVSFMKRVDAANNWREATLADVRGSKYGSPFPNANALFIGRMTGGTG